MDTTAKLGNHSNSVTDARYLVALLASLGVRHFVYCPGSRCAPFAYALADLEAADPSIKVHPKIDERSAAFFALGIAKAADAPVAVIMTSGTAVAHTLPAVMEAHHTNTPLLIISADRPYEMRGVGASQTTQQVGIFSHFVRSTVDLPAGLDLPAETATSGELSPVVNSEVKLAPSARKVFNQLRHLARAWQLNGPARGPVHLNVAFRDPLVPVDAASVGAQSAVHFMQQILQAVQATYPLGPAPTAFADVDAGGGGELLNPKLRTALVVGEHRSAMGWDWQDYLEKGYLILAEPGTTPFSTGVSAAAQQQLVTKYGDEIEQLVVIGRPTLSRPITALINRADRPVIVVAEPTDYPDLTGVATFVTDRRIDLPPLALEARNWAKAWQEKATAYVRQVGKEIVLADGLRAAQIVWDTLGMNRLIAGASNAIRYLDLVADTSTKHGQIYANRGQAGIDGTIAFARGVHAFFAQYPVETGNTATGNTAVGDAPEPLRTVVLLGDITFLHDASSLLNGLAQSCPALDIVVLDDFGGRIFASLEHGQAASETTYERFFAMGQKVDYQALATAYGWSYQCVRGLETASQRAQLQAMLSETQVLGGRIIHVECNHTNIAQQIRELFY
ncbi:MAG: 2-succinyl-5-enolpyruvyl-6-hydroxy-3-cyclohexene-1-carboxylic-acid synthase [Actinomycetaceae bacterium]|nr:2-succinyl-5-enolpyruvyl-6-hydroxy-3-cyclohexene-1-carboxylic-acid synthase [Actinomycetaceae bacterium]